MSPLIRHGDVVTVMPFTGTAPFYGSVVAFERPDTHGISVHRIVGRRRSCFLLKEDACLSSDGFVPSTKILGRVTRLERKGKRKRLGLGWERYLIAMLTRWGLLQGLLGAARYRLADSRKRGQA